MKLKYNVLFLSSSNKADVDDSFISHGTYDDVVTLRLVQAASDVSGKLNGLFSDSCIIFYSINK